MNKIILATGAFLGLLGIILGAFAAHGLEKLIDFEAIKSFETGVRYQMYHAFLFLIVGSSIFLNKNTKRLFFILALLGVFCFSGSIYALATNNLTAFDFKTIALVTPLGGVLLILAWMVLCIGVLKFKKH